MNIKKLKNIFGKERIKAIFSKDSIKNLCGIFKKKKKIIFALEVGREWVKAAVSREGKAGFEIVGLSAEKITAGDEGMAVKAVKSLVRELKPGRLTSVISLPRHSVTVRYLRLPSVNLAEIEEMTKLQAVKQLPYSRDELIIAHKILEKDAEGYSKVMLVAVHRDVLNKYINMLKAAGIEPELVALSSEALERYSVVTKSFAKEDAVGTVALIDIDLFFTEIQIQRGGNLVFSRSLHQGLKTFENKTEDLIEEIKLSFNTYAREKDSADIGMTVLTGVAWRKANLDKALHGELKFPIEAIYPLQNIRITEEARSKFEGSDYPVSFSNVIAIALSYQELKINLLPPSIQSSLERKTRYKRIINIKTGSSRVIKTLMALSA